jgi:hypothetical protein
MPLIWGEMGRGIFLLEGLDRANHVELVQKNRAAAHPYVRDNLRHHGNGKTNGFLGGAGQWS